MLRLQRNVSQIRQLSTTVTLDKKRGFGKKGRKGRLSVMGGKFDQDFQPQHLRGFKSKLARNPDWDSAVLSPRKIDRVMKNLNISHAKLGLIFDSTKKSFVVLI